MACAHTASFGVPARIALRSPSNEPSVTRRRPATPFAGLRAFRKFNVPSPGDGAGDGNGFNIGRKDESKHFEPFDGSRPLLPPFRPSTPEADFSRHGERVRKREEAAREAREARKVVAVRAGSDLLYAEMVQEAEKSGNVWLRPLMLHRSAGERMADIQDGSEAGSEPAKDGQWMDLRQTSDLLLPKGCLRLEPLEPATRTVLDMTLAATETDLYKRVIDSSAGLDSETSKAALSSFLQTLFSEGHE